MRSRPGSPRRRHPAETRRQPRTPLARVRRLALWLLLGLLLAPPALLLLYRFVPVPLTPLMVIRLAEGEGFDKQWRALDQIAPAFAYAAIAAEDNQFCTHSGFDWQALGEVLEEVKAGERPRGASTITMQTAKNLFLWPSRSLVRKGFEAWLTPQIELLWPKRRILEVYLNNAELGPGVYGAEAAAKAYFGKPAASLAPVEAALLAAVLPNPREWSPARPTDHLERRADTILTRIQQLGPMLACADPA